MQAATYYVDNSPEANCANTNGNGTEANPWCTLNYGLSRMKGGDTLLVKSGTYNETLYIASGLSGTESQPTVIKAYPGSMPVVRGTGFNTGRAKIIDCSYLVFDGIGVTNMNQGIYIESSSHITIQDCTVFEIGQEGIHVHGNSEYITIEDCIVHDTGKGSANGEGIYVGTGSAGPLDNTHHVTIRNNTVYNTSTDDYGGEAIELKPGTHDCVIEGNLIYNSRAIGNYGAIQISESHNGVQAWNSNPNHIVRNNILHDTGTAIHAGTGCLVYNNVIYALDPGAYGVLVNNRANDSHTRRIYHNTIDALPSSAYKSLGGSVDLQNNVGPASGSNVAASPAYFVFPAPDGANYELVPDSTPIDAGIDLSGVVVEDFRGIARPVGEKPDAGAFEYVSNSVLIKPSDLIISE